MSSYAFFKPSTFGLEGVAYGSTTAPLSGDVEVHLVASGRWSGEVNRSSQRPASEVLARQVSQEEALSGIGTFVGAYLCLARVTPAGAAVWDYGVVTAYRWDASDARGFLTVVFNDGNEDFPFDQELWHELNVVTYILQPCAGRSTLDLMPGEMRDANVAVFNHFHGHGRIAARSVKLTATRLGLSLADEARMTWLYDYSALRIRQVNAKSALDYIFYVQGDRRIPKSVRPGSTLFDSADGAGPYSVSAASATVPAAETTFSDSDDSSDNEVQEVQASAAKRARTTSTPTLPSVPVDRNDPNRLRAELEELARGTGWVPEANGTRDTKAQFQPSAVQVRVHTALVNGTFNAYDPQLLMESLQSFVDVLGFLPHPAILRALYAWDFGLRGLSILHFTRLSTDARHAAARAYDMTDFSRKNKMPPPATASTLDVVVECVDCLTGVADIVFKPVVHDLLVALRQFLVKLRISAAFSDSATLPDLCRWIDGRLEGFRAAVAQADMDSAGRVHREFAASHTSFQEMMNTLTERRLLLLTRAPPPTPPATGPPSRPPGGGANNPGNLGRRAETHTPVPPAVLSALPMEKNKALCMRYLSRNSCRGRNGGCMFASRGHFRPASLPKIVRDFINDNMGGLKPEFASL